MNSMNLDKKLAFISFCLEEYKTQHSMDGAAAAALFGKYGVMDYLMEHYEILHSFGREAVLDDIEQFIQTRKERS